MLGQGCGVRDSSKDAAGMTALRRIEEAEPVVHLGSLAGGTLQF